MEMEKEEIKKPRKGRNSLLIWMLLILLGCFIYGLIDANGRTAEFTLGHFFNNSWRNGLSLAQTLWDTQVFWGEFWFNLFISLFMAGIWLFYCPVEQDKIWKKPIEKTKRWALVPAMIAGSVFLIMLASPTEGVDMFHNWFPTNAAYQIIAWPLIIASFFLLIAPYKKFRENGGRKTMISKNSLILRTLILFSCMSLWLLMMLPTAWNFNAIISFEIPLHTWLMTMFFPMGGFIFVAARLLRQNPKMNLKQSKFNIGFFIVGVLCIVLPQLIPGILPVGFGQEEMFSLRILWWWPASHWPSWLFSICMTLSIVNGSRYFYQKRTNQKNDNFKTPSEQPFNLIKRKKLQKIMVPMSIIVMFLVPMVGIINYNIESPLVLVNQIGYLPEADKRILFQAPMEKTLPDTANFDLINSNSGQVILTGDLIKIGEYYEHQYMEGNFTAIENSGSYYIRVTIDRNSYDSPTFKIGDNIYDLSRERAVNFFYYQRCGYNVEEIVSGFKGHEAGHLDDAMIWNGSELVYMNLTGGWHDAGDYNKYNSWFFTQWFCVRALADAWEWDSTGFYTELNDQVDSTAPDILDEILWGASYLVKCVDVKGLRDDTYGKVIKKVVDWNYADNRSALMSYWGPPEGNTDNIPNTGDERVVWDRSENPSIWGFASAEAGYGFAGALLQSARLIDEYQNQNPAFKLPSWATNTTYMREIASLLNTSYYSNNIGTHIYSLICRQYYEQEAALFSNNYENAISWADDLFTVIDPEGANWIHSYAFARLFDFYLDINETVPDNIIQAAIIRQNSIFAERYVGPFKVFNGIDNDNNYRLFGRPGFDGFHGVINCDMFGQMYFQVMFSQLRPDLSKMNLLQYELDYLFGINPLGLCQMDGIGGQFVNQIHHRYSYANNPSGRIPGGIINGIANVCPSQDWGKFQGLADEEMKSRWLLIAEEAWVDDWVGNPLTVDGVDSDTNEIWIPHDAMYLEMLSSFIRLY